MANLNKNNFDIPDYFAFAPPLLELFGSGRNLPTPPNLGDVGLKSGDISNFFNLKRAIGRAGIQRQGAASARAIAANLPGNLRNSTVPASLQAGVQTELADKIAQFDTDLIGQEMNAKFQLFDVLNQQFRNQLEVADRKRGSSSDALEVLSFLPLVL